MQRRGKPYSPAYVRRQLASLQTQLVAVRAMKVAPGDWRRASNKSRELVRLEAEQMRFERLASPPPLEQLYELPF